MYACSLEAVARTGSLPKADEGAHRLPEGRWADRDPSAGHPDPLAGPACLAPPAERGWRDAPQKIRSTASDPPRDERAVNLEDAEWMPSPGPVTRSWHQQRKPESCKQPSTSRPFALIEWWDGHDTHNDWLIVNESKFREVTQER